MLKRRILAIILVSMVFMGVVSASSINGDYKGNPIVKVMSNGQLLESDEVPAMIYDGHTLVPISLLRQIGVSVTWDAYNYSVDVKLPQNSSEGTFPDLNKLSSALIDEVAYIDFSASSIDNFTQLSFSLKFNVGEPDNLKKYQKVIDAGTNSGVRQLRLVDKNPNGGIFFIKTQDVKDQFNKKITTEEFLRRIEIYSQNNNQQNAQIPQNTNNTGNTGKYDLNDAVNELGFPDSSQITVAARDLAIELLEIRKTKSKSSYSIQDALMDLGIPKSSTPTLATLKQAIKLISIR